MSTTIEQARMSWQGVEMSAQQFLALPDDGIHRELVRGRVREDRELWEGGKKGSDVTVSNRSHDGEDYLPGFRESVARVFQ
jgi:hypothetical protein